MFETHGRSDSEAECASYASADPLVAKLLTDGPGAHSAAVLDSIDLRHLSRAGTLDYLRAWDELTAWSTSRPMSALVAFAGSRDARIDGDGLAELHQSSAFEEVRLALNVSLPAAESRVEVARALSSRLRATAAALHEGRVSYLHARAMVESLSPILDDDVATEVERKVLPKANRPVGRFRHALRTAIDSVDPEATVVRHRTATAERTVKRWELLDGMACLQVEAPAPDISAMWGALSLLAGPRESDDPRSLGARRVDAMLGLCLGAVAPDPLVDSARPARVLSQPLVPVQAQIVVDLATLIGLADNPAELRGYGQIPATLARDWLEDATTWRRLVTDPVDGHLLDYGPVVRSAPPKLRDYVLNRHPNCCFPGCTRSSINADLDHQPAWREDGTGGRTSAADLRPLCRRHHRVKTFVNWYVEHLPDGAVRWISPSGVFWSIPPPRVLDSG